jgi:glycerophosphoryl diester phosphodiesterase
MRPELNTEFFDPPLPRIIAHRGASGEYPENTIAAFHPAAEAGAPYFELDVHMARDGEIVVMHDPELRRTTGREGTIPEMTFAELREADAGYNFSPDADGRFHFRGAGIKVPALAELFAAFPTHRFIVEIKQTTPSLVSALIETIDRGAMRRRVLIASEHQAPMDEVRALAPALPTNFSSLEVGSLMLSLAPGAAAYVPKGDALQVPPEHHSWKLITAESIAAAHRCGVELHAWTINDPAEMRALLELGVDAIISDYPARLIEVVRSR